MWLDLRENPASTHTIARHTFHHQLICVHINQQFRQVSLVLKVSQITLLWLVYSGLLDVHKCSDGLKMAPWTSSCNSPPDWLMSLAMNLAALYDMWRWKLLQQTLFGCFQCGRSLKLCPLLCGSSPPPTLQPCRSACGIGYAGKNLSEMVGNPASYLFNSWCIDRLWIAIPSWWIVCKHLFSFPRYIYIAII